MENLNEHMASKEVTEISEQDGRPSMSDRYFAIIQKDESGPALGIAKSESGAWLDADTWGLSAGQALDCKCVEIDEETFEAIKRGISDAPRVPLIQARAEAAGSIRIRIARRPGA